MKHISCLYGSLIITVLLLGCNSKKKEPVTPAEYPNLDKFTELVDACKNWQAGGGTMTTGGKGASNIFHISSLADDDPHMPAGGTLRYAINQTGPRIIVFDVAGTIELKAPLEIDGANYGDLSILGQTAPGEGICVARYPLIIKNSQNIIVQFMRFRLGNESLDKDPDTDYDAISVNDSRNILIDHCSASWSVDECVSCYGNENFTLQYSFITESLRDAGHVKGPHGYGGIWGGKNASFHHNLLAHHDSRNPRFDHDYVDTKYAGPIDFVNNVVYNWGGNSAYGGEGTDKGAGGRHVNFVNNYYKPGPSTNSKVKTRLLNPTTHDEDNCGVKPGGTVEPGKFYVAGNYMYGSQSVTDDNWSGVYPDESSKKDQCKASIRWTDGLTELSAEQAVQDAYETVLTKSGCSLRRDAVDQRIVTEVRNGEGRIIDKPADVGGWPDLDTGTAIADTDYDGMPDAWETKYGLDPNSRKDARIKSLVSGYTNIEVYAAYLVKDLY